MNRTRTPKIKFNAITQNKMVQPGTGRQQDERQELARNKKRRIVEI
jgi:hypothetical protein